MDEFLQAVVNAIDLGSFYSLLALGIALIFGVVRLVNFAHGELIMVGAYALVALLANGVSVGLAVPVVILCVALASVLLERVAFRPVRAGSPSTLLVTSLAVSALLQNGATLSIGALPKSAKVPPVVNESWSIGFVQIGKLTAAVVVMTALLLTALVLFLRHSVYGLAMRAAAEDFSTARLVGVSANRVISWAFGVSGAFAGAAATIVVLRAGAVTPTVGVFPVIVAFVATIIGGLGSLVGAVAGSFLLGFLTIFMQTYLPTDLQPFTDSFLFVAVIVILVLRPQGLANGGWVPREV